MIDTKSNKGKGKEGKESSITFDIKTSNGAINMMMIDIRLRRKKGG